MKFSGLPLILLLIFAAFVCCFGCTAAPDLDTGSSASPNAIQMASESFASAQLNETLADIDVYAEKAMQRWNVPGMAVAIVKDGRVIFEKAYGVKTAGLSDPVTTDTVFEVGSDTKAFMSALVAMEVDSGRMNWTDPVVSYVPDFQMSDPWITKEFTLTDALAHRSGLYEKWGQDLATLGFNQSETIHALRYAEPVTSFRSSYRYQNIFYLVDAAAVENTSGMSFEENVMTRIFAPLGMKNASAGYAALLLSPDHAGLHVIGELSDGTLGPVVTNSDWRFNTITDFLGPAGDINANIKDMASWVIFQLGNGTFEGERLISPENMAYMHTPQTPIAEEMKADSKQYYCLGWIYEEKNGTASVLKHTGETLGSHAYILMVPDENLGIVVLANEAGIGLNEDIGDTFYKMYYGTYMPDPDAEDKSPYDGAYKNFLFPASATRPENPASPLPFADYTGSYTNDVYGTAIVAEENGNLTLTLGKDPITLYLSSWDGNTFKSTCPEWSWIKPYDGRVTFETAQNGTVSSLTTSLFLQKLFQQNATFKRFSTV